MFAEPLATRLFVFLTAASLISSAALANEIVPVAQDRSVEVTVINPRCQPSTGSQQIHAADFAPFAEQVDVHLVCGGADGRGLVTQESEINPLAILAHGTSRSEASADARVVIHTIGGSFFEVTFSIDEPTTYTLDGELRAMRQIANGMGAGAGVSLLGAGDIPLATFAVGSTPDGVDARQPISASAPLAPGTYRLRANAWAVMDTTVPPNGIGEGEFTLRFDLATRCATDLNGDRVVDLADLSLLLSEFGCTGDACLTDMDGDNATGLGDLALLLSDFGTGCE